MEDLLKCGASHLSSNEAGSDPVLTGVCLGLESKTIRPATEFQTQAVRHVRR